ncbi:type IV pilin protein [uncultured Dechloromonas sp.]|uniref:type IV pilin protein n=1 Tax=uncultured Dechloromonas sp. TaxID=171719 RepID=UPI0025F30FD0|nr:type IV pilin protein [uncultured Dechloromonas sp.]
MKRKQKTSGFTLIELMVVMAIIAIIAAIAYPSYQQSIQRTRRAAAAGCMMGLSQFMERYYTTNMSYLNAVLPACQAEVTQFYQANFAVVPTATTYTLQVVPQGAQANDVCGTLSIDQTGLRAPDPAVRPECWR